MAKLVIILLYYRFFQLFCQLKQLITHKISKKKKKGTQTTILQIHATGAGNTNNCILSSPRWSYVMCRKQYLLNSEILELSSHVGKLWLLVMQQETYCYETKVASEIHRSPVSLLLWSDPNGTDDRALTLWMVDTTSLLNVVYSLH